MVRLILLLTLVSSLNIFADDVEIPDDLYPIEGASEILYSYEFDDKPKFIERISDTEFLILIIDGEDVISYVYNTQTNVTEKKSEFEVNDDEWLDTYRRVGDKLYLYFKNVEGGTFLFGDDGFYIRQTVVDLKTFLPMNSEIVYTTIFEEEFDIEDYNDDLDYASKTVNKNLFIKGLEEKEIEEEDFTTYYTTYDLADSNHKNILQFIYEDDEEKLYLKNTTFKNLVDIPKSNIIMLQDSVEDYYKSDIHFTYLDKNSNVFFIYGWTDDDTEKKYLSFNKISPDNKLTKVVKEIPLEIDDDEYNVRNFELISITGKEIKLFGIARYEDEGNELEPIAALYIMGVNLETLEFELKTKTLTEDEGEELNNDDDELKFNKINKIIETKDGYVVLAENNKLQVIATTTQYGTTYTYLYYFNDINLFALDKELNFKWNNFIDRDFFIDNGIFGNETSSYFGSSPIQVNLIPSVIGDEITYIYSTTEPEDDIRRVTYNIKTGDLVKETPLFENDGVPSYSPGYQFPIGNNEYVTLVYEDDYYVVRYKLLK